MHPGGSIGLLQQSIGLVISHDPARYGVPGERAAHPSGDVGQDASGAGDMTLFDVGYRFAALVDGLQEVEPVGPQGRGDMFLQVLFRLVFGVLFQFVCHVPMDGPASPPGE